DAAKDKAAKQKTDKPKPIRIDFDGIRERIVEAPVPPGNYSALVAIEGKLHWMSSPNRGMVPPTDPDAEEGEPLGADLQTFEIDKAKVSTLASKVLSYGVSRDGKVLVFRTKEGFTRVEAGATSAPKPEDAADAKIDLGGWPLEVDPRKEWRQMLHEAWRLQRDFVYDSN